MGESLEVRQELRTGASFGIVCVCLGKRWLVASSELACAKLRTLLTGLLWTFPIYSGWVTFMHLNALVCQGKPIEDIYISKHKSTQGWRCLAGVERNKLYPTGTTLLSANHISGTCAEVAFKQANQITVQVKEDVSSYVYPKGANMQFDWFFLVGKMLTL